jgi:hypothetical protein
MPEDAVALCSAGRQVGVMDGDDAA